MSDIAKILNGLDLMPTVVDSIKNPALEKVRSTGSTPYGVIVVDSIEDARRLRSVDNFKYACGH